MMLEIKAGFCRRNLRLRKACDYDRHSLNRVLKLKVVKYIVDVEKKTQALTTIAINTATILAFYYSSDDVSQPFMMSLHGFN